jgi:hypothetical protein
MDPGPSHVTGPEPKTPSPGVKIKSLGSASVVAVSTPVGVGIHAVTENFTHNAAGTQNHVPTLTTNLSCGGAVSKGRDGIRRSTLLREIEPSVSRSISGIQYASQPKGQSRNQSLKVKSPEVIDGGSKGGLEVFS